MAREDVNIKVSSNIAEAIQLWKAMEAGPEGMAGALEGMGRRGKSASKGIGDELLGMVGKWASIGAAVAAVTKLISDQHEAVMRLREARSGIADTVDDAFNRFQVQAGVPAGGQADRLRSQLLGIAVQRRVTPETAFASATQLVSSGATVDEVMGGGLDAMLKTLTATNAAGRGAVDPAELSKAMVMYLTAHGQRPTGENILQTGTAVQRLFQGTNLQIANLARFAPEVDTIQKYAGTGAVENAAIYSQFLDVMDESRAAVSFRSGVVSLATAGANNEKVRALKMLGLAPEDVDFQGESFADVQSRLSQAFGAMPGEKANIAAKLLFGQEALGFYNVLLNDEAVRERTRRTGLASDQAGFAQTLSIAESGRGAEARQAESLEAFGQYSNAADQPETVRKRLSAMLGVAGLSEGRTASLMAEFDDPWGPNWLYDMTDEGRAERFSKLLIQQDQYDRQAGTLGKGGGIGNLIGNKSMNAVELQQHLQGQMLGRIDIRITGSDGQAVPHEVEAVGVEGR